jgi:hypothetical protein
MKNFVFIVAIAMGYGHFRFCQQYIFPRSGVVLTLTPDLIRGIRGFQHLFPLASRRRIKFGVTNPFVEFHPLATTALLPYEPSC